MEHNDPFSNTMNILATLKLGGGRCTRPLGHNNAVPGFSIQKGKYALFAKRKILFLGFGVLTAVVMKSSIFWDIIQYSPLKANQRFGGKYLLHLQDRRINKRKASGKQRAECCGWYFSNFVLIIQATNININSNTPLKNQRC
jgi:hypothetical protein